MSKKNKKYIIFLVVNIVLLFCLSVSIVLFFKDASKDNTPVNADDVSYVANSNTIIIKNIISVSEEFGKTISDENGGSFGYLEFDVVNRTNLERNYQIFITKQIPSEKEINSSYITFYLTDNSGKALENYTGNKLPSFDDFHYIEDKAESKSIYMGTLKGGETTHFVLRVWIADNYVVTNSEEVFSFEIDARAI